MQGKTYFRADTFCCIIDSAYSAVLIQDGFDQIQTQAAAAGLTIAGGVFR